MGLADLFRPRWRHSRPEVRVKAVSELTDRAILLRVALHDSDPAVQLAAVGRIDSQTALASIAMATSVVSVARAATVRLSEDASLLTICRSHPSLDVRLAGVARLNSQGAVAEIARTAQDLRARHAAIERLTDEDVCAALAQDDPVTEIRQAAARRINSQKRLEDLVAKSNDVQVQLVAVSKLQSDDAICTIIRHSGHDLSVRKTALGCLRSDTTIAGIALADGDLDLRRTAVTGLWNPTLVENIARDGPVPLQLAALEKVICWEALSTIGNDTDSDSVRAAVGKRLASLSPDGEWGGFQCRDSLYRQPMSVAVATSLPKSRARSDYDTCCEVKVVFGEPDLFDPDDWQKLERFSESMRFVAHDVAVGGTGALHAFRIFGLGIARFGFYTDDGDRVMSLMSRILQDYGLPTKISRRDDGYESRFQLLENQDPDWERWAQFRRIAADGTLKFSGRGRTLRGH